jgi:hypothetical protein
MSGTREDLLPRTLVAAPPNLSVGAYWGTKVKVTHIGTIRWNITDDTEKTQVLILPNSLLVPTASTRLLSPQHLAQSYNTPNMPASQRANTVILEDRLVLTWSKHNITKRVPLDKSNIGTICTQPGYSRYEIYCAKVGDYNAPPQQVCATCSFEDDPKAYTA